MLYKLDLQVFEELGEKNAICPKLDFTPFSSFKLDFFAWLQIKTRNLIRCNRAAINQDKQQLIVAVQRSLKLVKKIFKIPVYLYRLAKQILFLAIHQLDRY